MRLFGLLFLILSQSTSVFAVDNEIPIHLTLRAIATDQLGSKSVQTTQIRSQQNRTPLFGKSSQTIELFGVTGEPMSISSASLKRLLMRGPGKDIGQGYELLTLSNQIELLPTRVGDQIRVKILSTNTDSNAHNIAEQRGFQTTIQGPFNTWLKALQFGNSKRSVVASTDKTISQTLEVYVAKQN